MTMISRLKGYEKYYGMARPLKKEAIFIHDSSFTILLQNLNGIDTNYYGFVIYIYFKHRCRMEN